MRTKESPPRLAFNFDTEYEKNKIERPLLEIFAPKRKEDFINRNAVVELKTEFRELGELLFERHVGLLLAARAEGVERG